MISFKHFVLIFIFFQGVLFSAQENTNVKVIIKLRPIENFRGKLKNCTSSVFENNVLVSKKIIQGHKFKFKLDSKSIYKIVFEKKPYVSKHIIVNCTGIPPRGKSKFKLKADISLFRYKKEYDTSFLAKEPISVGYYNEIKEEMIWDFEYNRSMVEKIIHTMTKK